LPKMTVCKQSSYELLQSTGLAAEEHVLVTVMFDVGG